MRAIGRGLSAFSRLFHLQLFGSRSMRIIEMSLFCIISKVHVKCKCGCECSSPNEEFPRYAWREANRANRPQNYSNVHLPQLHVQSQCQHHHSSRSNEAHISISILGDRKVYQSSFTSSPSSDIIYPAVFRYHLSSTRRCCASNSRWATARRPRCIGGAYRYSDCAEEEAGGAAEEGSGYAGDWGWYWWRLGEDEEILEGR